MATLTREQIAFLEECEREFSDRYTTADPDFAKVHETGIPPPPIVFPWYGRSRQNNRGECSRNYDDRRSDNRGNYDNRRSDDRRYDDDRRFNNKRHYDGRRADNRGNYNRDRGYRGDGQY